MAITTPIIYYNDISKIGKDFVGKKDISQLTNEQALLESVKNIIMTEPGERVMYPEFGCKLSGFVFEMLDPVSVVSIKTEIINSVRKFEDRVDRLNIDINENDDTNSIELIVVFNMKTSNKPQTLILDLNKIR